MIYLFDLRCPECSKLLGRARDAETAGRVLLWCKRCRKAVTPRAVSREPEAEGK